MKCRVLTTTGKQCRNDASAHLPLCHVHDPNGEWMRQHPEIRERWLRRADVQALMRGAAVAANHCRSCSCVRHLTDDEIEAAASDREHVPAT